MGKDFAKAPVRLIESEGDWELAKWTGRPYSKRVRVLRIFISSGHNFVGHHGGPAGRHPVTEISRVDCVAGMGLFGDRFFGHRDNYKGQVTFFSTEVLEDLRQKFRPTDLHPGLHRRNVLLEGIDLNHWIGHEFEVQGVRFAGTEEARPCLWMDQVFGAGAVEWMRGKGGLRARILSDGCLTAAEQLWGTTGSERIG